MSNCEIVRKITVITSIIILALTFSACSNEEPTQSFRAKDGTYGTVNLRTGEYTATTPSGESIDGKVSVGLTGRSIEVNSRAGAYEIQQDYSSGRQTVRRTR